MRAPLTGARALTEEERQDLEDVLPVLRSAARRASLGCKQRLSAEDLLGNAIDGYLAGVFAADPSKGPRRPFALRRATGAMLDALRRAHKELPLPSQAFDDAPVDPGGEACEPELWTVLRKQVREHLGLEAMAQLHRRFVLDPEQARQGAPDGLVHAVRAELLSALAPRDRELLVWRWDQELDGPGIAARLGKSKSQANRMLAAAYGRFEERARVLAGRMRGLDTEELAKVLPFTKPREAP